MASLTLPCRRHRSIIAYEYAAGEDNDSSQFVLFFKLGCFNTDWPLIYLPDLNKLTAAVDLR